MGNVCVATQFAYHIRRYADIYTSRVENLINYPLNFVFFPDRAFLPHEVKVLNREQRGLI